MFFPPSPATTTPGSTRTSSTKATDQDQESQGMDRSPPSEASGEAEDSNPPTPTSPRMVDNRRARNVVLPVERDGDTKLGDAAGPAEDDDASTTSSTGDEGLNRVPLAVLANSKQADLSLGVAQQILKGNDWRRKRLALRQLQEQLAAGEMKTSQARELVIFMESLAKVCRDLKDTRPEVPGAPRLVQLACVVISMLAKAEGAGFCVPAAAIIPELLPFLSRPREVVQEAVAGCIEDLVAECHSPGVLRAATVSLFSSKKAYLRRKGAGFLRVAIERWPKTALRPSLPPVMGQMRKALFDADATVRREGRHTFGVFIYSWPAEGGGMYHALDRANQKAVLQEQPHVSNFIGSNVSKGLGVTSAADQPPASVDANAETEAAATKLSMANVVGGGGGQRPAGVTQAQQRSLQLWKFEKEKEKEKIREQRRHATVSSSTGAKSVVSSPGSASQRSTPTKGPSGVYHERSFSSINSSPVGASAIGGEMARSSSRSHSPISGTPKLSHDSRVLEPSSSCSAGLRRAAGMALLKNKLLSPTLKRMLNEPSKLQTMAAQMNSDRSGDDDVGRAKVKAKSGLVPDDGGRGGQKGAAASLSPSGVPSPGSEESFLEDEDGHNSSRGREIDDIVSLTNSRLASEARRSAEKVLRKIASRQQMARRSPASVASPAGSSDGRENNMTPAELRCNMGGEDYDDKVFFSASSAAGNSALSDSGYRGSCSFNGEDDDEMMHNQQNLPTRVLFTHEASPKNKPLPTKKILPPAVASTVAPSHTTFDMKPPMPRIPSKATPLLSSSMPITTGPPCSAPNPLAVSDRRMDTNNNVFPSKIPKPTKLSKPMVPPFPSPKKTTTRLTSARRRTTLTLPGRCEEGNNSDSSGGGFAVPDSTTMTATLVSPRPAAALEEERTAATFAPNTPLKGILASGGPVGKSTMKRRVRFNSEGHIPAHAHPVHALHEARLVSPCNSSKPEKSGSSLTGGWRGKIEIGGREGVSPHSKPRRFNSVALSALLAAVSAVAVVIILGGSHNDERTTGARILPSSPARRSPVSEGVTAPAVGLPKIVIERAAPVAKVAIGRGQQPHKTRRSEDKKSGVEEENRDENPTGIAVESATEAGTEGWCSTTVDDRGQFVPRKDVLVDTNAGSKDEIEAGRNEKSGNSKPYSKTETRVYSKSSEANVGNHEQLSQLSSVDKVGKRTVTDNEIIESKDEIEAGRNEKSGNSKPYSKTETRVYSKSSEANVGNHEQLSQLSSVDKVGKRTVTDNEIIVDSSTDATVSTQTGKHPKPMSHHAIFKPLLSVWGWFEVGAAVLSAIGLLSAVVLKSKNETSCVRAPPSTPPRKEENEKFGIYTTVEMVKVGNTPAALRSVKRSRRINSAQRMKAAQLFPEQTS